MEWKWMTRKWRRRCLKRKRRTQVAFRRVECSTRGRTSGPPQPGMESTHDCLLQGIYIYTLPLEALRA